MLAVWAACPLSLARAAAECGLQTRLLDRGLGLLERERFLLASGPLTEASLMGPATKDPPDRKNPLAQDCAEPLAQRATLGLALSLHELGEGEESVRLLHDLSGHVRPELAGRLRVTWAWIDPSRAGALVPEEAARWERWQHRAENADLLEARAKRPVGDTRRGGRDHP